MVDYENVSDGTIAQQEPFPLTPASMEKLLVLSVEQYFVLCNKWANFAFIYSFAALIVSTIFTISGVLLFISGISGGMANLTALFPGVEVRVNNAAPGIILFITGMLIVFFTVNVVKVPVKMLEKLGDPRGRLPWMPTGRSIGTHTGQPVMSKVELLSQELATVAAAVLELTEHVEGRSYDKGKIAALRTGRLPH